MTDISTTFRSVLLLQDDISTYPAALGRHFNLSYCSGTTFLPILVLWHDISIYPAAPTHPAARARHFHLSCWSRTTFRPILLHRDNISAYRSCCSRTTFRSVLLLWVDIPTYPAAPGRHFYPAAPGRHFDLSCYSWTQQRRTLWHFSELSCAVSISLRSKLVTKWMIEFVIATCMQVLHATRSTKLRHSLVAGTH